MKRLVFATLLIASTAHAGDPARPCNQKGRWEYDIERCYKERLVTVAENLVRALEKEHVIRIEGPPNGGSRAAGNTRAETAGREPAMKRGALGKFAYWTG